LFFFSRQAGAFQIQEFSAQQTDAFGAILNGTACTFHVADIGHNFHALAIFGDGGLVSMFHGGFTDRACGLDALLVILYHCTVGIQDRFTVCTIQDDLGFIALL
jgi:hypothetical protein